MMSEEIREYLRLHPQYYIQISRYPESFQSIVAQYKKDNKKTLLSQLDSIMMLVNMMNMMR